MRIAAAITTVFFIAGCSQGAEPAAAPEAAPTSAGEAAAAAPAATPAALPVGSHSVSGRVATVSLPYRLSDGLAWVTATRSADARPFVFKGLEVRPGAGPQGTDLAVFTYEADGPGEATLEFGLVPQGRMLVGPDDLVFKGSVAQRYSAQVKAE